MAGANCSWWRPLSLAVLSLRRFCNTYQHLVFFPRLTPEGSTATAGIAGVRTLERGLTRARVEPTLSPRSLLGRLFSSFPLDRLVLSIAFIHSSSPTQVDELKGQAACCHCYVCLVSVWLTCSAVYYWPTDVASAGGTRVNIAVVTVPREGETIEIGAPYRSTSLVRLGGPSGDPGEPGQDAKWTRRPVLSVWSVFNRHWSSAFKMLMLDLVRSSTCIYVVLVTLFGPALALPTREQILELYHRAPQHIKDALARHGIHAHNLPSPASLATLHTSSLIANHPGLANSAFAGRLNLHALASRAQAILKRPPSQLPFPIPSFNKNSNNNAAQLQRRSGLVLPFPIKKPQQQQPQHQKSISLDSNEDTIPRQLPSPQALAGPPLQIVTVPPHIEGLHTNNHHIKPVSTIINFGPPVSTSSTSSSASTSSASTSDGIITGRPMREGLLPVKPSVTQTPSPPLLPIPQSSSGLKPIVQIPKVHKPPRPETVVSARSFSNPFDDSNDNPLSRPFSVPLNVRNPKYEYGGFVPIPTTAGGAASSSSNHAASPATNFVLSSPVDRSEKHVHFANGFVIEEEPAASSPRISGPVVPGAVVRDIAPYNLVKKTTALVEACQTSKQDFCVMDDESYPKLETEHFLRRCEQLLDAMYVRPNGGAGSQYNATIGGFAGSGGGVHGGRPLCDAERKAKRLAVARDIHGQWAVLVQAGRWPQKAHVTLCRDEGRPCQRLGGCSVKTRCVQRFAPQTLIALDPLNPETCPTLRAFALPSACECTSA